MHRNTVRFDADPARRLTLVARGTMWPVAIEVDGETWERTDQVDETTPTETVRVYKYALFPKRRTG